MSVEEVVEHIDREAERAARLDAYYASEQDIPGEPYVGGPYIMDGAYVGDGVHFPGGDA